MTGHLARWWTSPWFVSRLCGLLYAAALFGMWRSDALVVFGCGVPAVLLLRELTHRLVVARGLNAYLTDRYSPKEPDVEP